MIFKITPKKDELIEGLYEQAMKELGKFYDINWIHSRPTICILDSRAEIDAWRGNKTEPWVIGWADGRTVYLLNPEKYAEESNHVFRQDEFSRTVVHELSHLFYHILSRGQSAPRWLCEGAAVYLSGQFKFKKPVQKFSSFLDFYNEGGAGIYAESGLAISLLVDNFGKAKLLKLIKETSKASSKTEFNKAFKKIYGFSPAYGVFNKFLSKKPSEASLKV